MQKKNEKLYLEEYILLRLEEVREERCQDSESEFLLGETYAFVECLEVILKDKGVDNETLLIIEKRYGVR